MNTLSTAERARILCLLCEGGSIRSVIWLPNVGKNTVIRMMIDAGKAYAAYHDEHSRHLTSKRIQVDRIWSFLHGSRLTHGLSKRAENHAHAMALFTTCYNFVRIHKNASCYACGGGRCFGPTLGGVGHRGADGGGRSEGLSVDVGAVSEGRLVRSA